MRAIVVFLVMNLFTCIWNPVTNVLIANEGIRNVVQAIVTKVVTGGVAMVIIFAADNKSFAPGWGGKNGIMQSGFPTVSDYSVMD